MKNVIEIYKESGRPTIRKSNNEYAGACPSCGGHDRLIMWQTSRDPRQHYGNFYCRQCGIGGGAEKLLQLLRNSTSIIQQKTTFCTPKMRRWTQQSIVSVPNEITDRGFITTLQRAQYKLSTGMKNVEHKEVFKHFLQFRHIKEATAIKYHLGIFDKSIPFSPDTNRSDVFKLPVGIVIPTYRDNKLRSIKIRTIDDNHAKYTIMRGCQQLPFIIKEDPKKGAPIIIVESELDAILLAQEAGPLFNYIALGSASAKIDIEIAEMIEKSSKVFFCPDYDEPGFAAFSRWKEQFKKIHLAVLPKCKDPTEAIQNSVDIKEWALKLRTTQVSTQWSLEQRFSFTKIRDSNDLTNFIHSLSKIDEQKTVAIEYDSAHGLLAFSDGGTHTAIGRFEDMSDTWLSSLAPLKLYAFDPTILRRDIPEMANFPAIESILFWYHALTGKGEGQSIASLSRLLLGHRGGQDDLFAPHQLSEEKVVAGDARAVAQLAKHFDSVPMKDAQRSYYTLLRDAQQSLADMMRHGLTINWEAFKEAGGEQQCANILHHRDDDGRVRAWFSPCTVITGRLSCSSPNLHSFPNELKHTVIAPEGYVFVDADYRQSELRIAATLAQDTAMLEAMNAGLDIHRETAARIFKISPQEVTPRCRQVCKAVNFSFLYGQTAKGLFKSLHEHGLDISFEDCQRLFHEFGKNYPNLVKWKDEQKHLCMDLQKDIMTFPQTGITTSLNRFIPINILNWSFKSKIVNYIVQGSASEMMLYVLNILPKKLSDIDAKIVHCIHDEFLLEVAEKDADKACKILTETMTESFQFIFNSNYTNNLIDCGIGKTWAEAK